ncbi:MAG TPA: sulfotransferase [Candidatus Limnocylindria bacterium]|nr:sulfotransferase [Candidatus Limnocylindria bacterium]
MTMPRRIPLSTRVHVRMARDLRQIGKRIRNRLKHPSGTTTTPLFVFGCQRSGTTLLLDLLDQSPQTLVFYEEDRNVMDAYRLRSTRVIDRTLAGSRAPFLVFKPLTESQHAARLLAHYGEGRGIWMFRDYRAVAASAAAHWPGLHRRWVAAVREGVAGGEPWQTESMSAEVRDIILSAGTQLSDVEAAALFWFARNALLFEQGLDACGQMMVIRYEGLVSDPDAYATRIAQFAGTPIPPDRLREMVLEARHQDPPPVRPSVQAICDRLLERLVATEVFRRAANRQPDPT